ncbi:MAG: PQQ-like beta-propeller repeat protein, partial [Bryobacteraceae bacterium]|nr:PQQ-like beta-propeller repeat protein [Bryobacteraceae bacterium]
MKIRAAATLLAFACLHAADWPQFRGVPQMTGVVTAKLPAKPRVLWTFENADPIESSPAIVAGVVYTGTSAGELLALDLSTGKLKWRYKAGEAIGESSPAAVNNIVYIGDLDGTLHAVNAIDGKKLWTLATKGEIKGSPVVLDGKVLIGSYDGNLYAADAKTGKLAWTFKTQAQVHATPSVYNGLALISGCDGFLRAIRVTDGKEAWNVSIGAYTGASPAFAGTNAYFGTFDNQIMGVDL